MSVSLQMLALMVYVIFFQYSAYCTSTRSSSYYIIGAYVISKHYTRKKAVTIL